jgi:hypothetical protein
MCVLLWSPPNLAGRNLGLTRGRSSETLGPASVFVRLVFYSLVSIYLHSAGRFTKAGRYHLGVSASALGARPASLPSSP